MYLLAGAVRSCNFFLFKNASWRGLFLRTHLYTSQPGLSQPGANLPRVSEGTAGPAAMLSPCGHPHWCRLCGRYLEWSLLCATPCLLAGRDTGLCPCRTPCEESPWAAQLLVKSTQWHHSVNKPSFPPGPFTQQITLAQQAFLVGTGLALLPGAFKEDVCQDRKVLPH